MAGLRAGDSQPANTCSVCLELVKDTRERSIAKLICGHQFHLDCIGSAFNAKGLMQCPNCRQIENGDWLYGNGRWFYGNGPFHHEPENVMFEEQYNTEHELFAELLFPEDLMHVGHSQWHPYQGSYTQLSFSLGNWDHRPIAHAEVVVDMLVESSEVAHPLPSVLAQAPASNRHAPGMDENVRGQESSAHLHHGASHRLHPTPSSGEWDCHSPAFFSATGVLGGGGPQEDSRWPQLENQSAGHFPSSEFSQSRHHGRRRRLSTSSPSVASVPASQFAPRAANWEHSSTSAAREVEPRSNANIRQRRREGTSMSWPYASESEGWRWAPPPLSGLYGTHGILYSEVPSQGEILDPCVAQPFHLYPSAEDNTDVQPSTSFYH